MPIANCREDLKNYCLRSLGAPVIQINVTPDQIEDKIDDALAVYWEFHHEGSYRDYVTHVLTADNMATKRVPVDPWIYTVLRVLRLGAADSLANLEYTAFMQRLGQQFIIGGEGLVNYTISMSYLGLLNDFFSPEKIINFNQRRNYVQIESAMNDYKVGDIIVLEVYRLTDPHLFREVWNDFWLQSYTTALIKRQWGQNMLKYDGFQMPSGITLNGRAIYQDALTEIAELEAKLQSQETLPVDFFVG